MKWTYSRYSGDYENYDDTLTDARRSRLRQAVEFSEKVFQKLITEVYGTAIDFLGLN